MATKTDFKEPTVEYEKLLSDFKEMLKQDDEEQRKFTKQRALILETLYHSHGHLTPEELHSLIQKKHPDVTTGIATIYRTLQMLEDYHIVSSISFGAKGKKYELGLKKHHDHMICEKCGSITEFVDEQIEERQHKISKELGFKITDHSMQIYGLCKNCQ
jgi:Fur family ferric uptake transcriptional regulator